MSTRIFKYPLEPERRQIVQMPRGAKPISIINQDGFIVMYAEVPQYSAIHESDWRESCVTWGLPYRDPYENIPRIFTVVTTGETFATEGKRYIGTCVVEGWYIAHVYEQEEGFKDPIDPRGLEDLKSLKKLRSLA